MLLLDDLTTTIVYLNNQFWLLDVFRMVRELLRGYINFRTIFVKLETQFKIQEWSGNDFFEYAPLQILKTIQRLPYLESIFTKNTRF